MKSPSLFNFALVSWFIDGKINQNDSVMSMSIWSRVEITLLDKAIKGRSNSFNLPQFRAFSAQVLRDDIVLTLQQHFNEIYQHFTFHPHCNDISSTLHQHFDISPTIHRHSIDIYMTIPAFLRHFNGTLYYLNVILSTCIHHLNVISTTSNRHFNLMTVHRHLNDSILIVGSLFFFSFSSS